MSVRLIIDGNSVYEIDEECEKELGNGRTIKRMVERATENTIERTVEGTIERSVERSIEGPVVKIDDKKAAKK